MMSNRLNLILDFNNLAMRALHTCQFIETNVDVANFETEEECAVLVRKLFSDITYIIRSFSPDRVIFACDSKYPWRKNIDESYKSTREKDEKKNWKNIFASFNESKDILRNKGLVVTEFDNTEADDIAALWKEHLFDQQHENIVFVSSDKDWTQLISFNNETNSFCICFNPVINTKKQKRIYVSDDIKKWLDAGEQVDIFFRNYNIIKKRLNSFISSDEKNVVEVIDPRRVLLDKIMCGDDGDNVPAFFDYYKNGKKNRVTPLKASHVFETLNIHDVKDLIKANDDMILKDVLEKEMKRDVDVDFSDRLIRQRKLVELNSELFPVKIVDMFTHHKDDVEGVGYDLTYSEMKMDDLLKDSKFLDEDYHKKVKQNSIFNDFNSLNLLSSPNKLF